MQSLTYIKPKIRQIKSNEIEYNKRKKNKKKIE